MSQGQDDIQREIEQRGREAEERREFELRHRGDERVRHGLTAPEAHRPQAAIVPLPRVPDDTRPIEATLPADGVLVIAPKVAARNAPPETSRWVWSPACSANSSGPGNGDMPKGYVGSRASRAATTLLA